MENQYIAYINSRINGVAGIYPNAHSPEYRSVVAELRDRDKTTVSFIYPIEKLKVFDTDTADELIYRITTV